jgi:hypothetical protein
VLVCTTAVVVDSVTTTEGIDRPDPLYPDRSMNGFFTDNRLLSGGGDDEQLPPLRPIFY